MVSHRISAGGVRMSSDYVIMKFKRIQLEAIGVDLGNVRVRCLL
jgi:hypothetical protein